MLKGFLLGALLGALVTAGFDRVGIECHVPRYNQNDGTRFDSDFCAEWVPLPK